MSDSVRPHGLQPTRLLRPWGFPGESTGVGATRPPLYVSSALYSSLSCLTHSVWECPGPSVSLQAVWSFLWLSDTLLYVYHSLLYPFLHLWALRLLPCPGYCKPCCSEHRRACIFLTYNFLHPCSFDLISFTANGTKHLFIVLVGHLYILLEKRLFRAFIFFSKTFVCFFIWLLRVLVVARGSLLQRVGSSSGQGMNWALRKEQGVSATGPPGKPQMLYFWLGYLSFYYWVVRLPFMW